MEDSLDYSTSNLEHCSYRHLQQLAKSMNLPSNVKFHKIIEEKRQIEKIHLIEMINAKKCSPEAEVARIVKRIKQQRQHLLQVKKRTRRIIQVDSSDSESGSPPITMTPKRPVVVRCNPELRQVIISQNSLLQTTRPGSDRVLRSFHIKPINTYVKKMLVETSTQSADQGTQMSTMRIVRKYKPNILSNSHVCKDRQLVPVSQMPASVLVKRPRLLSGIYPIKDMNFHVQSVGVRNREGKMSKINAFIHKPHAEATSETAFSNKIRKNIEVTIQDIINGNLDAQANMQSLNYPNTSGVTVSEAESYPDLTFDTSVYYHKKIRAEQVRERRMSAHTRCELPRINEAFGQFRVPDRTQDVTQPLYVQVSEDSERTVNSPALSNRNTRLLETVYNFRSQFLTHQPLLQPAPLARTTCVYSTPTLATAVALTPSAPFTEPYVPSFDRDSQYHYNTMDNSRMNDCLRFADPDYDYRCNEERATSNSSLGTARSAELGATVTISDMVEDALELISQDGDYMERTGMDVRMQCVLCNWAGPKIILEHHIRKVHSNQIDKQEKRDWTITYSLGNLVHRTLWSCRVIEHDATLYVLSVKYEQPDYFLASLSALSCVAELTTGSITIFNKVTGEPHSWSGPVPELPPNLPYDNDAGLKLNLAEMNLLPNSANIRFVNGELRLQSPTKVVFGQELNDIHVILFVRVDV